MKNLGVEKIGKFRPSVHYIEGLDRLVIVFEKGGHICYPTTDPRIDFYKHWTENRIIGISIWGFSQIKPDWFED